MNATHLKQEQKYFFSHNNFDEDAPGKSEHPKPAVYTQKDIDDARKSSFADGHRQAMAENAASAQTSITAALGNLQTMAAALMAAEKDRQRQYEMETLYLVRLIAAKLFPAYDRVQGFKELEDFIAGAIGRHQVLPGLQVQVHPDVLPDVEARLRPLFERSDGAVAFRGDPALPASGCHLTWQDGGCLRDPEALAAEIHRFMDQVLAGRAAKGHDGLSVDEAEPTEPEMQTDTKTDTDRDMPQ